MVDKIILFKYRTQQIKTTEINKILTMFRLFPVCRERDEEDSFMLRWVVGLILHGGRIELFLIPAKFP